MQPGYLNIPHEELIRRAEKAKARLAECDLCPNNCGVNRLEGQVGICRAKYNPKVASYNLHNGEEPAISGLLGSGTIFFSNCTLKCGYCQNWPISQKGNGVETDIAGLARMMLELKNRGAHNINLVTPTHYMPQFLEALCIAVDGGFDLPIVYNTSGYEVVPALRLLDGIVDIYLPDMRYACDMQGKKYSKARMYSSYNRAAVKEMFRQVGNLITDEDGVAVKGLIIRHLVLPGGISGTLEVMRFIAEEVSKGVHISLMDQYFPAYKADGIPELARKITLDEYESAIDIMESFGLHEGWIQEHV
jgi:putative pyruvate formate lyase activating enzyme